MASTIVTIIVIANFIVIDFSASFQSPGKTSLSFGGYFDFASSIFRFHFTIGHSEAFQWPSKKPDAFADAFESPTKIITPAIEKVTLFKTKI